MRKEELCGNNDVIEDSKVTGETVGGAKLCQHQMHLVDTRRKRAQKERDVFRTHVLKVTVVWMYITNKVTKTRY